MAVSYEIRAHSHVRLYKTYRFIATSLISLQRYSDDVSKQGIFDTSDYFCYFTIQIGVAYASYYVDRWRF